MHWNCSQTFHNSLRHYYLAFGAVNGTYWAHPLNDDSSVASTPFLYPGSCVAVILLHTCSYSWQLHRSALVLSPWETHSKSVPGPRSRVWTKA